MIVLGLTGSIGMGKTTAARALKLRGVPVLEADRVVHRLTATHGPALPAITKAFPGTVSAGRFDRAKMAGLVFADASALKRLEAILHPLYEAEERRFVMRARGARRRVVAIDIPLMYEVGADRRMDAVIVVTAPAFVQRARVLSRPGMTEKRLAGILARQMPDLEKRRRADYLVSTGGSRREALRRLKTILDSMLTTARRRRKVRFHT